MHHTTSGTDSRFWEQESRLCRFAGPEQPAYEPPTQETTEKQKFVPDFGRQNEVAQERRELAKQREEADNQTNRENMGQIADQFQHAEPETAETERSPLRQAISELGNVLMLMQLRRDLGDELPKRISAAASMYDIQLPGLQAYLSYEHQDSDPDSWSYAQDQMQKSALNQSYKALSDIATALSPNERGFSDTGTSPEILVYQINRLTDFIADQCDRAYKANEGWGQWILRKTGATIDRSTVRYSYRQDSLRYKPPEK